MWKIIFVECRPVGGQRGVHRDPNAIAGQRVTRFFSNTCQKMRCGKHVKIKKQRRQDILCFLADARKLISPPPIDHLSVNILRILLCILYNIMSKKYLPYLVGYGG